MRTIRSRLRSLAKAADADWFTGVVAVLFVVLAILLTSAFVGCVGPPTRGLAEPASKSNIYSYDMPNDVRCYVVYSAATAISCVQLQR